jgi:hypothetical protein
MEQRGIARHGEWSEAAAALYNKTLTEVNGNSVFVVNRGKARDFFKGVSEGRRSF